MTNINLSRKMFNPVYLPYLETEYDTEVYYGGSSSGKSKFISQKVVYTILKTVGVNWLCTRKTGNSLKTSVYNEIKQTIFEWELQNEFHLTENPLLIKCANGNEIHFGGLDKVEKKKSIKPTNGVLTHIWMEEATETTRNDKKQLLKRLRGKSKNNITKQMILSFNPISILHWIKRDIIDIPDDRTMVLHTTYRDNNFLTKQDIRLLEDEKDPYYFAVYTNGEWGTLGEIILKNYVIQKSKYKIEDYDSNFIGVDFGFNHAFAVVNIGLKDDDIYIYKELYEFEKTNTEMIRICNDNEISKDILMICESAEPDRIKEFVLAGYKAIACKKTKGTDGKTFVKSGIEFLRNRKIYIDPDCVNVINEIQQWRYRKTADDIVTDDPIEVLDDAMAALRYAIDRLRMFGGRVRAVKNIFH